MKFARASAFLNLLLLGLIGCESPSTTFDAFPIRHPQNLEKKLGSRVRLVSARDTLELRVHHEPHSGRTVITQVGTSDTLLNAWALRHHQLYYLVQPLSDGACWVHAVRIQANNIQGLATGWEQMMDLSEQVKQGTFPTLVRYQNVLNDSSRLRFDARQLHKFYSTELDSFPVYRFASVSANPSPTLTAESPTLYPNPAQHYATLRFTEAGKRTIQLLSLTGQCLYRTETAANTLTLPVAQLPVGQYVIRASGLTKQKPISLQLLVSR
ncbi:T9SS type A sorting domain-containing protein [Hymenobacter fodinae]|uniref:T9SS type A sorting domain-containing protein n=1 Tax=Hymenobacter fodinae TaxID=2510796 RepID=A0A4Z0PBG2_9BACT|nr:T9SS type A sorting domain-containing protein [Hymenobacter fodinae]TGE09976.1 T9SS type A sorting domain-containing protein [Hymenobacter fodinae]